MLPDFYKPRSAPFKHQVTALERGWRRRGYGYLMEMGLAKTRVTIDNACMLHVDGELDALLVVASKSVYTNWTRVDRENPGELQKWLWDGVRDTADIVTWRSGKIIADKVKLQQLLSITPGLKIFVVNVEALSLMRDAFEFCMKFVRTHRTMIAVDESTLIGNKDSARTKALMRLRAHAPYRRILTGSPGKPTKLFSQFEFLEPGCLGHRSFYTFRERYCILRDVEVGGRTIKTEVGVRNLDELAEKVAKNSYRARKIECLDLPAKIYEKRLVELTKEQAEVYSQLRKTAMAEFQGKEVTTNLVLTQMLRLHQVVCGHVKTDDGVVMRLPENRTAELMRLVEDDDEQTIIWCRFRSDIEVIKKLLMKEHGDDCLSEWYGDVPINQREHGEKEFQMGRRRFMLSSYAGARGRTWTAATLAIYYSNDLDLELRQQSEDRNHRIGQSHPCTYVDLVSPDTVDEKIIKSLRASLDVVSQIMRDGVQSWI